MGTAASPCRPPEWRKAAPRPARGESQYSQERLRKCFQYVSQVLQRELDRLGEPAEALNTGAPEEDAPERIELIMSGLCRARGFTKKPVFLHQAAYEWLVQEGYLTAQPRTDNKWTDYQPIQKGGALGFQAVEYTSKDGRTCIAIQCKEQGRQLLRENMEPIIARNQKRWKPLLDCLTPEWHSRAACAEKPITLMALLKHIHSQLPENLPQKLSSNAVSDWLVWKGILEPCIIRKSLKREPTQAGEQLGLQSNQWETNGKVLYPIPVQQFILDNLNGIVQDLASGDAYRWGPQELVLTSQAREELKARPKLVGPAYMDNAINSALGCGDGRPNLIPRKLIASWLFQEGYTFSVQGEQGDKIKTTPTPKGAAAGLAPYLLTQRFFPDRAVFGVQHDTPGGEIKIRPDGHMFLQNVG